MVLIYSYTIVDMYGFSIGTYGDTRIGSLEVSTERSTGDNLEGLMIGDYLGYLDGIDIGTNVGCELGLSVRKYFTEHLGGLVVL